MTTLDIVAFLPLFVLAAALGFGIFALADGLAMLLAGRAPTP